MGDQMRGECMHAGCTEKPVDSYVCCEPHMIGRIANHDHEWIGTTCRFCDCEMGSGILKVIRDTTHGVREDERKKYERLVAAARKIVGNKIAEHGVLDIYLFRELAAAVAEIGGAGG